MYNELSRKITAPVGIQNIARCLGSNSTDLGTLCCSELVNKWSLKKPVNVTKKEALTDSDFKDVNYGFNIPIYNNAVALNTAIKNGETWLYVKPQSGYYRATDFDGYSHLASNPFLFEVMHKSVPEGSSTNIVLDNDISFVLDWAGFTSIRNIGIYIPNIGFKPMTGSEMRLVIDDTFKVDETYRVYLIATNMPVSDLEGFSPLPSIDNEYKYILMPFEGLDSNYFTVMPYDYSWRYFTFSGGGNGVLSANEMRDFVYSDLTVNVSVSVTNESNFSGTLYCEIVHSLPTSTTVLGTINLGRVNRHTATKLSAENVRINGFTTMFEPKNYEVLPLSARLDIVADSGEILKANNSYRIELNIVNLID